MTQFRFSLEVLLKHREDIEERERDALMRIRYAHQVALDKRRQLDMKLRETKHQLAHAPSENYGARELQWFQLYLKRLDQETCECDRKITDLESDMQKQKKKVIEATQNRKVLSTLEEKQKKEYLLSLDKKEQKEIEEWIVAKYSGDGIG